MLRTLFLKVSTLTEVLPLQPAVSSTNVWLRVDMNDEKHLLLASSACISSSAHMCWMLLAAGNDEN